MPARQTKTGREVLSDLVQRSNDYALRLRATEERYNSLHSRVSSMEQVVHQQRAQADKALSAFDSRIAKIENQLAKNDARLKEIVDHLKKTATKINLKGLEELVDLFNPLTSQFMTREEVENLIAEKLLAKKTNI